MAHIKFLMIWFWLWCHCQKTHSNFYKPLSTIIYNYIYIYNRHHFLSLTSHFHQRFSDRGVPMAVVGDQGPDNGWVCAICLGGSNEPQVVARWLGWEDAGMKWVMGLCGG